jgi:hypothetical protein
MSGPLYYNPYVTYPNTAFTIKKHTRHFVTGIQVLVIARSVDM